MTTFNLKHKDSIEYVDKCIRQKYIKNFPGMFYLPNSTLLVKFSSRTSRDDLGRALQLVESDPSIIRIMHVGKDRYGRQLEHKAAANYSKALDMAKEIAGNKNELNFRYVNGRNVVAMIDAIREGTSYINAKGGKITELRQMDDLECRLVKRLSKLGLPIPKLYEPCLKENKPSTPMRRYMEVGFDHE